MKHIIMVLILLILNINFKTWRRFPGKTPTLIYVTLINFLYYFICQKKLVWDFKSNSLSISKVRLLQSFLGTPLITLLCLSGVPHTSAKDKNIYLIICALVSTFFEWVAHKKLNMISFYNGWNIKWSLVIYLQLYFFSYYHTKYPFFTWVLSILSLEQYISLFKIPLSPDMLKPASVKNFFITTFTENYNQQKTTSGRHAPVKNLT